jgi:ParB-like chromosome segregation protein Spo0J
MSGDHMRHGPHDLESHPIADAFPMMDGTEFAELVDDIKANGVREPIVLHEGRILDGRNRYRAAQMAGVECPRTEYQGTDPIKYVVSLNLRRRHLNESQRAWVGKQIAKLERGANQHTAIAVSSQSDVAELLNVSEDSIQRARFVDKHGVPELGKAVAAGEVSVSAAADVARLPEEEQREIVAKGSKGIKKAAKREREKRAGEAKRKCRTNQEIDRECAEKVGKKRKKEIQRAAIEAESERCKRRDALGSLLRYYDQPTDKAREAAERFVIDERGSCWGNEWPIHVGGIRRAAEHLKALADILEGRGLSQEPVYDDDDAADVDGNAIPEQSEPGPTGETELQADRSRCA